jgi:uncharacterized membrane protein YjdF
VKQSKYIWPAVVIGLILIATAAQLHLQGRLWRCACPHVVFTADAWSSQTSQLFFDPYSLTHVLHGLMFAGVLALALRRLAAHWRFVCAIALEAVWEIIENTNVVIQRYREATASLGYQGDTVVNSLGDIFCCAIGFLIARKLGWRWSIALFFAVEAVLLVTIKDSLLLEILMLFYPVEAIKAWQIGH